MADMFVDVGNGRMALAGMFVAVLMGCFDGVILALFFRFDGMRWAVLCLHLLNHFVAALLTAMIVR